MEKLKKFWKKNERVILIGSSLTLLGSTVGITMRYRKDIRVAQVIDTIRYKPFEDGTLAFGVKFHNGNEKFTHMREIV